MKALTLSLTCLFLVTSLQAEPNWARFRGPLGTGHTADTNVPISWNADSIVWKLDLGGTGQSSPVNWGDRMFLTVADASGEKRKILCIDKSKGELLWERSVEVDAPEEMHKMSTWATPTCATDGEVVVSFFGPGGLHAFDLEGAPLWSKDLGDFPSVFGIAASPIIVDNMVIQNCDAVGASYLVALDKKTGEEIWKTPRTDKPKGGWCTPILYEVDGKTEMALNGEEGIHGYDPTSGEELWFCRGFNGRGSPVPDYAHGLLYVVNGKPGDTYTVRPGGSGDVTETHMEWRARRHGGRDLPSPAVVGDYLLISSMSGILTCYNAKTGEDYYTERLGAPVSASPLVANGLVYFTAETGETIVVKPAENLEIVSRNSIGTSDEIFRATLAPIEGQVFLRSQTTLYCIED